MSIKNIKANSTIIALGDLIRTSSNSNWKIELQLDPNQANQLLNIAHLQSLARRRIINQTSVQKKEAGYPMKIRLPNVSDWKTKNIRNFPPYSKYRRLDDYQYCFTFTVENIDFYLPQLELARSLFYCNTYLAKESLVPNGLSNEFESILDDSKSVAYIRVMPTCTLSNSILDLPAHRSTISWILLDQGARESFESISKYATTLGKNNEKGRRWTFQFDPPPLEGCYLGVRGHYDKESQSFLIYEIKSIRELNPELPDEVLFVDPRYREPIKGGGKSGASSGAPPNPDVDDEDSADSDKGTIFISSPQVRRSFRKFFRTRRVGTGKKRPTGGRKQGEDPQKPDKTGIEVSTSEPELGGSLNPGEYDGVKDESDETSVHIHKFEKFNKMVAALVKHNGYNEVDRGIKALPYRKRCSKQYLDDGSRRHYAYAIIEYLGIEYSLLEVDTTGTNASLSTLLLKQGTVAEDWLDRFEKATAKLVKNSLSWPSKYLNGTFKTNYRIEHKGIHHPRATPMNNASQETGPSDKSAKKKQPTQEEIIDRWVDRVRSDISSL